MPGDRRTLRIVRPPAADAIDTLLVAVFLFGIGTGIALKFSAGVPIPSVIAGAAGAMLLVKNMDRIGEGELQALFAVVMVYLVSILCADPGGSQFLHERAKGLIQLVYSLIIAYAMYLTAQRYDRRGFGRILLITCLIIIVGATLENYTGFRAVSDSFRQQVYHFGVYKADLRDQMLYGRIRPKLFTSEPSALTFAFTLFAFLWYVVSPAKAKLLGFLALLGIGYFLMRGPTLLLGIPLACAYELLLAPRRPMPQPTRLSGPRLFCALLVCLALLAIAAALGSALYSKRLALIAQGADPSFFSREIGPFLVAKYVMLHHALAGAGLTGEESIAEKVRQIYLDARSFSGVVTLGDTKHVVTNYFWSHWIYLGAGFGVAALVALTHWLRVLRAPSILFCWSVWMIFGQASGAYVGPKTWSVLLLACAVSVLHERQPIVRVADRRRVAPTSWRMGGPAPALGGPRGPA